MTRPLTRPSLDRLGAQTNPLPPPHGPDQGADQHAAPDAAPDAMPEGATQPGAQDVYFVKGNGVNIRARPSAQSEVLGKLGRGEAVTVIWFDPNGWARIRIEGDGLEGYMSRNFLLTRD